MLKHVIIILGHFLGSHLLGSGRSVSLDLNSASDTLVSRNVSCRIDLTYSSASLAFAQLLLRAALDLIIKNFFAFL